MSIQEMKEAVANLPSDALDEFAAWLNEYRSEHARPVTFEDIKHLAGVLTGGPRDLSPNKRYLEGLGERSMR